MNRFLLRRLGSALVILLVLSFVVFWLGQLAPGDPARAYVGANASNQAVAEERERLGFNDPFFVQYFRYLGGLLHGDLGRSLRTRQPVTSRHRHVPAGHRRTRRRRVPHRPGARHAVRRLRCPALDRIPGRPRPSPGAGRCPALPAGHRRHHRVLRAARLAARAR